jgi:3-methylcrotonyl-CoA carboxylase alpha subunit
VFTTLLIANRGEIACRVAATAKRLGIRTIAVFSDADANAKHVMDCDLAIHIGQAAAKDSYLLGERIIQAALDTGAQAIHPGYGFLSENEAFASAALSAGIVFVGPPASSIAAMGSKSAAKTRMAQAGVPLVPGYHGDNQDADFLHQQATKIGYPVLIKASAGGGGKGMRVVTHSEDFAQALSSCQREALASFGDAKVLIERYLQKPRHIEIQVFCDQQGQAVHLFERDCSVQRRHQKVIEEAPAPGMSAQRRQAMGEAAIAAAQAVGYVGAGTVEFITEPDGRFYFMEMNTRLQVEHPVTEMITGLDLVEWQLRIAAGESLPLTQEQLNLCGHAIEARIYAENPNNGFLPSIGSISYLSLPANHVSFQNGPVRIDSGVRMGDTISTYYDPMIAKLIVWGADRDEARARMHQALRQTHVVGVHTNVEFLSRLMTDAAFASADLDTGLIERQQAYLLPGSKTDCPEALALAVIGLHHQQTTYAKMARANHAKDPWSDTNSWRITGTHHQDYVLEQGSEKRTARLIKEQHLHTIDIDGVRNPVAWRVKPASTAGALHVDLLFSNHQLKATVVLRAQDIHVFSEAFSETFKWLDPMALVIEEDGHGGALTSPMPGRLIALHVKPGDTVKRGQPLIVMEAMKMEHTIAAPEAGVVTDILFAVGDQVTEGEELIRLQ